ncbi:MAG TPA: FtsX-like permease family protein, partial [Acidimicrobiales bacterium]|nr:FtsX-like permease family protein [Acidimicrobiales bacterium]
SPSDYPVYVPPTRVRVVGEATMPAIGATDNLHTSMGVGAELPAGIEPPAFRAAITKPDKNLDGPEIVVIRLRHGVRRAAATAGLTAIAALGTRVMRRDPNAGYATYIVIGPQRPAEIAVYESTGSTPTLLATALGAGAVIALGVALAASVRRRRRDLALLKTLGLTRGQVAATISVQASIVALVGTVVGVPVGIAIGRWLWILFAHTIAAVPAPTVPVTEVVVIALVALALANVVAALPGRAGARTPVAGVLRAE